MVGWAHAACSLQDRGSEGTTSFGTTSEIQTVVLSKGTHSRPDSRTTDFLGRLATSTQEAAIPHTE